MATEADTVIPVTPATQKPTWLQGIVASFRTQTAAWLGTFLIGILTLFSGYITESVKNALNRANLRTSQYETLATEISAYIFSAELNTEFIEKDLATSKTMAELITEYNQSITTLRKKEFVYSAWIKKFWDSSQMSKFEAFMKTVAEFDTAIHSLNDEFGRISLAGKDEKISPERAKKALEQMKPAVAKLRAEGRAFLESIN